jgi:Predicted HKD family nuclease
MKSPEFINNTRLHTFYNSLVEQLLSCTEFKISVAFISFGGLQVLLDTLQILSSKKIPGEIITTSYQNFTKPIVLERIASFPNIKLKIYVPPTSEDGFHAKGYLFNNTSSVHGQQWTIIIGSSNITGRALKSNIEWNVLQNEEVQANQEPGIFTQSVLEEFEQLWKSPWAKDYSDQFLISYRDYLQHVKSVRTEFPGNTVFSFDSGPVVQPNRIALCQER